MPEFRPIASSKEPISIKKVLCHATEKQFEFEGVVTIMSKRGLLSFAVCGAVIAFNLALLFYILGREKHPIHPTPENKQPPASTPIVENPDPVRSPEKNSAQKHKDEHPTPEPLLEGWDKPALTLILSGEQHGYFEPCGCSENQYGGVSRRADLFRQMQERGWPAAGLDLGGVASNIRTDQVQSRFKFKSILNALQDMKYQAMGLGPEEVRFGFERLLLLENLNPENAEPLPSFVSANVQILDGSLGPRKHKLIEVGDLKIGVTSILGKTYEKEAFPFGTNDEMSLNDPGDVLPEVLKELKQQKPDLLVLLAHASYDESKNLAKQFPEFNVILRPDGPDDGITKAESIGKAIMINVGRKGKHVGVVGFYPGNDKQPFRFELVKLDQERFKETPHIQEHMRNYQQMLKDNYEDIMGDLTRGGPHPNGGEFVGATRCGECHSRAYDKWLTTGHAKAYDSIVKGRNGIARTHDPECLSCHVTGWEPQRVFPYDSGFQIEEMAEDNPGRFSLLKGNQCENCHGPGSKHVELVEDDKIEEARKYTKITLEFARKQLCYRCHDGDNDPHYNAEAFDEYWEKIKHPWTD